MSDISSEDTMLDNREESYNGPVEREPVDRHRLLHIHCSTDTETAVIQSRLKYTTSLHDQLNVKGVSPIFIHSGRCRNPIGSSKHDFSIINIHVNLSLII